MGKLIINRFTLPPGMPSQRKELHGTPNATVSTSTNSVYGRFEISAIGGDREATIELSDQEVVFLVDSLERYLRERRRRLRELDQEVVVPLIRRTV